MSIGFTLSLIIFIMLFVGATTIGMFNKATQAYQHMQLAMAFAIRSSYVERLGNTESIYIDKTKDYYLNGLTLTTEATRHKSGNIVTLDSPQYIRPITMDITKFRAVQPGDIVPTPPTFQGIPRSTITALQPGYVAFADVTVWTGIPGLVDPIVVEVGVYGVSVLAAKS